MFFFVWFVEHLKLDVFPLNIWMQFNFCKLFEIKFCGLLHNLLKTLEFHQSITVCNKSWDLKKNFFFLKTKMFLPNLLLLPGKALHKVYWLILFIHKIEKVWHYIHFYLVFYQAFCWIYSVKLPSMFWQSPIMWGKLSKWHKTETEQDSFFGCDY